MIDRAPFNRPFCPCFYLQSFKYVGHLDAKDLLFIVVCAYIKKLFSFFRNLEFLTAFSISPQTLDLA